MAKKVWKNHNGMEVPAAYVPKEDKERERIVSKCIKDAKILHDRLDYFKTMLLVECDAFYEELLAKNNVKSQGKGNYSLTSFDKLLKIEVNVSERIEFDDNIQVAHAKIKEYLDEITKDSNTDIQQIVNTAFQTSKGKMDVKRVLGLFELHISHPKWREAMELIKGSISRNNSKRYVRIWEKDANGEYQNIDLNFSSI